MQKTIYLLSLLLVLSRINAVKNQDKSNITANSKNQAQIQDISMLSDNSKRVESEIR
jgi:hypothetical protein